MLSSYEHLESISPLSLCNIRADSVSVLRCIDGSVLLLPNDPSASQLAESVLSLNSRDTAAQLVGCLTSQSSSRVLMATHVAAGLKANLIDQGM